MRNFILFIAIILFGFSLISAHHNEKTNQTVSKTSFVRILDKSTIIIDSAVVSDFFEKYPDIKIYESEVNALYKSRNYNTIWYDKKGIVELANLLYSKINLLEEEGLMSSFAYYDKIYEIFNSEFSEDLSQTDSDIMLSAMYVFYVKKVFQGIDSEKIKEIGWFLPIKKISYDTFLDSLLIKPELLNVIKNQQFSQYYKLHDALKKYRQIEKNGDWKPILIESLKKEYKITDSSKTIGQIRHRLFITGDLKQDSKSNLYDEELITGILNFKKRNGFKLNYIIESKHIQRMNIPIEQYIKTIMVNMERCRWIDPKLTKSDEYMIVNIPAYKFLYKKSGKTELESKVIVGKSIAETVIFSNNVSKIVFSPTWNMPKSMIENELKHAIIRDENYMITHDMEWIDGEVIQKPGPNNPMGLVKFVFPNSYDIYLHDTPSKNLFLYDYRALSHGCINLEKSKELALLILKNDPNWPIERIDEAMKGEKETTYILKNKIPIYIGYFTAWVSDSGEINFYDDIYNKDKLLSKILFSDDSKLVVYKAVFPK